MTRGKLVAAVCYQRTNNRIRFLLVRTKGGKYWTFPKGHVKVDAAELPWDAAKREAGEEAGVDGAIEREPLTHYAYYTGKDARGERVTAFLMRVDSEREPDEPDRDPKWFTPEEAMEQLSKRRLEERFVSEHERVIKEAVLRLSGAPSGLA